MNKLFIICSDITFVLLSIGTPVCQRKQLQRLAHFVVEIAIAKLVWIRWVLGELAVCYMAAASSLLYIIT